jgi:hypothetical protein
VAPGATAAAKEVLFTGQFVPGRLHLESSCVQGSDKVRHRLKLNLRQWKSRHAASAIRNHIFNLGLVTTPKPAAIGQRRSAVCALRVAAMA